MELPIDTDALRYKYAKLILSHAELADVLKAMRKEFVQLNVIQLCMYDLIEQHGAKIPMPKILKELQSKQEEEPQQRQEERAENTAQAYMQHIQEIIK